MKLSLRRLRGPVPEIGPGWLWDESGRRIGAEVVFLWLRVQLYWGLSCPAAACRSLPRAA
ncbi:MAG TPA: hypothetical protein VNO81_10380 [Candidatus Nitrosotenuis sp.]|nr:hypothetical protein [Candidatus Nitrosotenuis sp.]